MEINKVGAEIPTYTLSATPQDNADILISHDRTTAIGILKSGLGYSQRDDIAAGGTINDVSAFIQWSSR